MYPETFSCIKISSHLIYEISPKANASKESDPNLVLATRKNLLNQAKIIFLKLNAVFNTVNVQNPFQRWPIM